MKILTLIFLFFLLSGLLVDGARCYGVFGRDRFRGKDAVEKRRNLTFFTLLRLSILIPFFLDFVLIYEAAKFALGENKPLILTIMTFSIVFPLCGVIFLLGMKGWEWIAKRFMNQNELRIFQMRKVKRKSLITGSKIITITIILVAIACSAIFAITPLIYGNRVWGIFISSNVIAILFIIASLALLSIIVIFPFFYRDKRRKVPPRTQKAQERHASPLGQG